MNHYCTYFDRHFLAQGLAMARSLKEHDTAAVLWVLCLDDFTASLLHEMNDERLRVVELAELEAADKQLLAAKSTRKLVEYYFTLSPCWPRYLLNRMPQIERLTYVDADMFVFSGLKPVFDAMGAASVLVTEHRHPPHLRHHLRCGRFNVGLLSFLNDDAARSCLDDWRERCLEWCHDRAEDGKYADQKYLDRWPAQLGERLHIVDRPGVNLAPWNWSRYRYDFQGDRVLVDGRPLEVFHFARFRPALGMRWFQSGQLEYGVMPWTLRQRIYGPYWRTLEEIIAGIRLRRPDFRFVSASTRRWHNFWRALAPRVIFGSDWLRIGPFFISGRFSLGRHSGYLLSRLRQWLGGRTPEPPARPPKERPLLASTPAEHE